MCKAYRVKWLHSNEGGNLVLCICSMMEVRKAEVAICQKCSNIISVGFIIIRHHDDGYNKRYIM